MNISHIKDIILNLPIQAYILIGVGILFFILNLLFPKKKKTYEEEQQDLVAKTQKNRVNYSIRTTTSYSDRTDGSQENGMVHTRSSGGYKKINKINFSKQADGRLPKYEMLLNEQHVSDLNILAKYIGVTNADAAKDIKYYKKKKKLFKHVNVSESKCKISYTDGYEGNDDIDIVDDMEEQENNIEFDDNGNQKCRCKNCGTINLVPIDSEYFTCFTCFSKNKVE